MLILAMAQAEEEPRRCECSLIRVLPFAQVLPIGLEWEDPPRRPALSRPTAASFDGGLLQKETKAKELQS